MKSNIKEKFKQASLTIFAIMLIAVGYMNFNIEDKKNIAIENKTNIGDVQLVSSSSIENMDASNTTDDGIEKEEELQVSNNELDEISEYCTKSRLERDKMYSENLEIYQKMVDSTTISSEQKAIAINEISKITNIKNSIMIAENLIKNKGFEDVLILVNNEIISIVVKTEVLTIENIAQIQNIISRQLGTQVSNINITNKY